ncbi:MAG: hypothetical protein AAGU23_03505, partial [Bacillota bacterium]
APPGAVGKIFPAPGETPLPDSPRAGIALRQFTNDRKEILVDCRCRTNVPGLLAAGDVTIAPEKQIVVAAGEGAKATLQAYAYLLQN